MRSLVGTGDLLRFLLRRDRIRLAAWVAVLAVIPVGTANAFAELYPTEAARRQLAATVASSPAMVAILGPVYDADVGALTAWRVGTLGALLVGVMAVLTMVRHTREEEETGRRELLGSTVVGRHAPLAAAYLLTAGTGLALGLAITLGMTGMGLDLGGSLAFGTGFLGVSLAFAAVGALAGQLTESASMARGIGVGVVGLVFLARVAGDGGEASGLGFLSWLSPIGWFTRLRAFAGEDWWVVWLWIGLALTSAASASALAERRDVGAGVVATRSGPPRGGDGLGSPLGLAWRLHRGSLLGWTVGLATIGVVYGSVADGVGELLRGNPQLAGIMELLGGEEGITEAFFSAAIGILALVAAAYSIRTVLRLRVEEETGRAELVLSTATTPTVWAAGHTWIGALGPLVMLAVAALVTGASYGAIVGDPGGEAVAVLGSALVQMPAVWVLTGFALAVYGLAPRFTVAAWGYLVVSLLVGQLGQILQFPQWSMNLSPFSHVPAIPAEELEVLPLAVLTALAGGLVGLGLAALRHRDLQPG